MEILRDVQEGEWTRDRINGICAYSQKNWEKVNIFRRFACWITGSFTEVQWGNEHFFVSKKSFQRVTKTSDLSDKAICDFFYTQSHGEIHAPKKRVGILALSFIKKELSELGVAPRKQMSIVQKVKEGTVASEILTPRIVQAAKKVEQEVPEVPPKKIQEPKVHVHVSPKEEEETLGLEELFRIEVPEKRPAKPVPKTVVSEKGPSLIAQEQVRKLVSLYNKLGTAPSETVQKRFLKQIEQLGSQFIKAPKTIKQDPQLAEAIIKGAERYNMPYRIVKDTLQPALFFTEKAPLERLRTIGDRGRYEALYQYIVKSRNGEEAAQVLEKLAGPSLDAFKAQFEPVSAEHRELFHRLDLLQKIVQEKKPVKAGVEPSGTLPQRERLPTLLPLYSSPSEADQALQRLYSMLGERAAGAFTLSRDLAKQSLTLHLLKREGGIVLKPFPMKQDSAGIEYYEYMGQRYDTSDAVLKEFMKLWKDSEIKRALTNADVGAYTIETIGTTPCVYIREAQGPKDYPISYKQERKANYTYKKEVKQQPQDHITRLYPGLRLTDVIDLSGISSEVFEATSPPGTYFTARVSKKEYGVYEPQELLFVLVPRGTKAKEVMRLEYTRRGKEFVLNNIAYPTLDALVKGHFLELGQVGQAKSLNMDKLKATLKEKPEGTFFEVGLSGRDVNTKLLVVSSKNSVSEISLWKEDLTSPQVTIDNKNFPSVEAFVDTKVLPKKQVPVQFLSLHSMESVKKLFEMRQSLFERYGCYCDESEEMQLLLNFEGVEPQPFFLRPVKQGEKGDFTLVSGVVRSKEGTPLPTLQENIEILPGGKVRHISNKKLGTYGRTFDSVEALAIAWNLGEFAYDSYVRKESRAHSVKEAVDTVVQAPMNSFLLWKSEEGQFFVTVRQKSGQAPKTYPLPRANGTFFFEGKPITHELITFLRGCDKVQVPSYWAMQRASTELASFLEEGKPLSLARFQEHSDKGNLFSLTYSEKNGLVLTTCTPRSWMARRILNPIIEDMEVTLLPNGAIKCGEHSYPSMAAFKKYLGTMHSVQLMERQKVANDALMRAVDRELQRLGCTVQDTDSARSQLEEAMSYLGVGAANRCLMVKMESGSDYYLVYFTPSGLRREMLVHVSSDGLVIGRDRKTYKTLAQLFRKLGIEPLNEITAQVNARKMAVDQVRSFPAFISGGRTGVGQEFSPYLAQLAASPQVYALCISEDKEGMKQIYLSHVNAKKEVVHEPISDALLQKMANVDGVENKERILLQAHEEMTTRKAFTKKRDALEESKQRFDINVQRISDDVNFYNISSDDAKKRLQSLKTDVTGCWLLIPEVATKGWLFFGAPKPDYTHSKLIVGTKEHSIQIDPRTGRLRLAQKSFDTLEDLLQALGATQPYTDLVKGLS